ncbi:hypothetical protein BL14DL4_00192 [Bacillus licheniformis]|uniref:hypothetical protein n=1 Tax=Bacillus licheniformis TaxID=1402 RepID=UPI000CF73907|nr:hypothetical protein [Bacillus licheniformis]AVI45281.1 hypothetical protein BL14DL4_00012 [Bacillus licheniformis]AVI45458.1 hypothetical protein BL14DL4_00192 [Bacillus licheniformis]
METTQHPFIQGLIKDVGFENKSNFIYTYEIDKEILHIYDTLNHNSTSAINCVEEIIAVLKETLQPNKTGINKIVEAIKNTISSSSPFKKVIIYTEVNNLTKGYKNRGSFLDIQAYDPKQKDFVGWDHEELYQFYYDSQELSFTIKK